MMLSSSARMPHRGLNALWLIIVTLLSGSFVTSVFGAPAKLDGIGPPPQTPFPLEAQPAIFTDAVAAALNNDNSNGGFSNSQPSAIDSYGNPIESLKPIDTPDGRKVISAQGLQFEIPNYASGITEIKKPADDLLPPFIDPIAVGVSSDLAEAPTGAGPLLVNAAAAPTTTTVDVENAQLVELNPIKSSAVPQSETDDGQNNGISSLPSYILELNDPDIGGPVEYNPVDDGTSLKVIAWDLLPPVVQEPEIITSDKNVPKRVNTQSILEGNSSEGRVSVVSPTDSRRNEVLSTSTTTTTPRTTTVRVTRPTTVRTTTTTQRPTTTTTTRTQRPTTTTSRPTRTTRRTTTTSRGSTTTTTPAPLDPNEFFQLENGDSYTIPPWLADIDDPELDAAVTYIVPEDIHEYNNTISRDILPPFEPYTDLNSIDLPAPASQQTTTSTTSRPRTTTTTSSSRNVFTTTTTRRPTVSTARPHWVRVHSTTARTTTTSTTTPRPHSFDDRISSNHIAQSHETTPDSSSTFTNSKVSTSLLSNSVTSTTSTTTPRPRLTTPSHQPNNSLNRFNPSLPTSIADHITNAEVENSGAIGKIKFSNNNPFLPARYSGTGLTNKFSTTTTTTSTTTPATPIEENPFDSATLPSWLADFDYTDLGPGVPFVYNTDDSNADVANDLLPPSQLNIQSTDATNPVFITTSPVSFKLFPNSPSLANKHDFTFASASTTTTRTFAFNNFPSKVTATVKPSNIHNSFAQVPNQNDNDNNNNNNNNNEEEEAATLPPVLFLPPTAETEIGINAAGGNDVNNESAQTNHLNANNYNQQKQQPQLQTAATAGQTFIQKPSSSSFNTNFAAPFEPTTAPGGTDTASSTDQDLGSSSTKTTFTKSNDGKVITNNIFGANNGVTIPSKQFGFSTIPTAGQTTTQKDFQHSTTDRFSSTSNSFSGNTQSVNKFATSSGFSTSTGTGKYTGGFGGSAGVLSSGTSIRSPSNGAALGEATVTTFAPKQPANQGFANRIGIAPTVGVTSSVGVVGANKYQNTFGGPPGVLVPFDNVKSG